MPGVTRRRRPPLLCRQKIELWVNVLTPVPLAGRNVAPSSNPLSASEQRRSQPRASLFPASLHPFNHAQRDSGVRYPHPIHGIPHTRNRILHTISVTRRFGVSRRRCISSSYLALIEHSHMHPCWIGVFVEPWNPLECSTHSKLAWPGLEPYGQIRSLIFEGPDKAVYTQRVSREA